MNELLIYGDINSWTASEFIRGFAEIEGDTLVTRVNSGGGSPIYGLGMITKFREFQGERIVKVDGMAHSTAGFFVLFAKQVEAIQQSKFIIHRAAYPDYYEQNYMSEDEKTRLAEFNKDMYDAYVAKIDVAKFEQITGKKLKDIFSMDSRLEVQLNAKQAKQVGLISRVVTLTPEMHSSIIDRATTTTNAIAANSNGVFIPELEAETPTPNIPEVKPKNTSKMTPEEFKAQHPDAHKAIVESGIAQERDRVGAWAVFAEIDPKAVAEGIKSGNPLSMTATAEFQMKLMTSGKLTALAGEAKPGAGAATDTPPIATTAVDALQAQVLEIAGIKPAEVK